VDPATGVSNREALTKEIADVMAQCDVCIDALAAVTGTQQQEGLTQN
jgi:hypothetical protein